MPPRQALDQDSRRPVAPNLPEAAAGTDAHHAGWIEVGASLRQHPGRLGFDHGLILKQSLERARRLLEHTTVAAEFCAKEFTISELRQVYEAVRTSASTRRTSSGKYEAPKAS
jgi:ADP-ribose pyrophosphatase YjhB (NUDIX family)